MRRPRRLAIHVCISVIAISAFAEDRDDTRIADDVRCAELAFAQSVEQRNRESFEAFLADDARFVGTSLLRGPAEILKGWQAFFEPDYPRLIWRPDVVEILADSRLALSRGPYLLVFRDDEGKLVEEWGYYNSLWRLSREGGWKIQVDVGQSRDGEMPSEDREKLEVPLTVLLEPCGASRFRSLTRSAK